MSATWVRAQAFGQPLTLTVTGVSRSGKRRSSSSTSAIARCLVSTIASLQNSMPVQAIVDRRHTDGRAERPMASRSSRNAGTASAATPRTTSFWYDVSRTPDAVLLDEVTQAGQDA